jgi:hypothetical protein
VHGELFRIETGPPPPPDYLHMASTGHTDYDGQDGFEFFRTLPRGTDGYKVSYDLQDGQGEQEKYFSGHSHSPGRVPDFGGKTSLTLRINSYLMNKGKVVGLQTWQLITIEKNKPSRHGVMIEQKKGPQEQ